MRGVISLAAAAVVLSSTLCSAQDAKKKDEPKIVMIRVAILKGNPNCSVEDGTVRRHAQPDIGMLENSSAQLMSGAERLIPGTDRYVAYGTFVTVESGTIEKGRLLVDVKVSMTELVEASKERIAIKTIAENRLIANVPLGEKQRLPLGEVSGKQTWVEFTIRRYAPAPENGPS